MAKNMEQMTQGPRCPDCKQIVLEVARHTLPTVDAELRAERKVELLVCSHCGVVLGAMEPKERKR